MDVDKRKRWRLGTEPSVTATERLERGGGVPSEERRKTRREWWPESHGKVCQMLQNNE